MQANIFNFGKPDLNVLHRECRVRNGYTTKWIDYDQIAHIPKIHKPKQKENSQRWIKKKKVKIEFKSQFPEKWIELNMRECKRVWKWNRKWKILFPCIRQAKFFFFGKTLNIYVDKYFEGKQRRIWKIKLQNRNEIVWLVTVTVTMWPTAWTRFGGWFSLCYGLAQASASAWSKWFPVCDYKYTLLHRNTFKMPYSANNGVNTKEKPYRKTVSGPKMNVCMWLCVYSFAQTPLTATAIATKIKKI